MSNKMTNGRFAQVAVLASVAAACTAGAPATEYDPLIDPANFVADISHPLLPYVVGQKWTYREGPEGTVEITVLPDRKMLMGVSCIVVHDVVKENGVIAEDTLDYYAQDKDGNVWYFGEDTKELDAQGNVKTTAGSWSAGVNGAKPGLAMPAQPAIGSDWREEYLAGEAEDAARAVSTNFGITVPLGSYTGCLRTFNYTALAPEKTEMKVYCAGVGQVWAEDLNTGETEEVLTMTK